MLGNPADHELIVPKRLKDALKILDQTPGLPALAGGTDLMVAYESGRLPPGPLLNIWGLSELKGIDKGRETVTLGALTTYSEIRRSRLIAAEFPMLREAAVLTGAIAIQNRGTLGGNIANASPAADSPPALLCYDAEVELSSRRGHRWVSYADFHQGYKTTVRQPNELITRVRLRRPPKKALHFYRKVGTREAQAISKVCFAGLVVTGREAFGEVRIALGSVAPVPLRCRDTELTLKGRPRAVESILAAQECLEAEIAPVDDIRSLAAYRRRVACNLLTKFLETACR